MTRQSITFDLRVDNPADTASAPPEVTAFTDKVYAAVREELMHLHPSFTLLNVEDVEDDS